MNNFLKNKLNNQEILLLNSCFVFGGIVTYILFLLFFTFYHQLATNSNTNTLLQLLRNIFFHKDHIRAYLSLITIVFTGCFFAHLFWLAMNKFNIIKKIIYQISLNICTLINNLTTIFSNYTQTKNIKTSSLLGKSYLVVFIFACIVAIFTHCLEIKEINFVIFIVMPLTATSLFYGIGFTLSNYIPYLDSIFPQNITDTKKLFVEVLKFFAITIVGMLLMLIPTFSKIIHAFN